MRTRANELHDKGNTTSMFFTYKSQRAVITSLICNEDRIAGKQLPPCHYHLHKQDLKSII